MKQDWEMNSVAGFVRILQESLPRDCESLGIKYGIPFNDNDETKILLALDQARKAYDLELKSLGLKSGVKCRHQVHNERIILNSLRKWSSAVIGSVEDHESPSGFKLVDVTRVLARDRKRAAIDSFLERNQIAASRFKSEPVLLLGKMAEFARKMLNGYLSNYWGAEPRFGTGAVFERIPMLARWERLKGLTPDRVDLDWALAACKTEARLCAVPKQWDKDRLITVEPFESTFLQHKARLALGRTLVNNGFRFIVDQGISGFDGPQMHRRRALEASVYASTSSTWGTLDLTDASDGITWDQVSWILPPEVMATLDRCRSESILYKDASGTNRSERMHIYGGMGNATTFMVESIVFYALMRASVSLRGHAWKGGSVVGDDLLVNGFDQVEDVLWGLTALGYKVNHGKSFYGNEVPVRESCGCWAFNGLDVYVPAYQGYDKHGINLLALAEYVRTAPTGLEDVLLSRLSDWVNTPVKVANTISVCDPNRVVTWDRIRWNRRTCQLEVKALTAETLSWYAPANYELTPEGGLAVLARQVTSSPVSHDRASSYTHAKQDLIRRTRARFCETYSRVFIANSRGKVRLCLCHSEEHENALDALMLAWHPAMWSIQVVSIADPYGTKVVHRWVSCQETQRGVAIMPLAPFHRQLAYATNLSFHFTPKTVVKVSVKRALPH